MKAIISFMFLSLLLFSCEEERDHQRSKRPAKIQTDFFKISYELKPYSLNSDIHFLFKNLDTVNTMDSISIFSDGLHLASFNNLDTSISTNQLLLGQNNYSFRAYFSDKSIQIKTRAIEIWAAQTPKKLKYSLTNTFSHDRGAYTQGLQFHNGFLYEGTGQFGKSTIRKVNITTGEVLNQKKLPSHHFGEGITIVDDNIYQLTWKSYSGHIYDLNTLEKKETFFYPRNIEGWGLTYNGQHLIMSDGSDRLFFWNLPEFSSHHFVKVADNVKSYKNINELEYVNGFIYANVYLENIILKINPETGEVVGTIDLTNLLSKKDRISLRDPHGEVLNGIAYNPKKGTFYITGKDWPKLFELKIED